MYVFMIGKERGRRGEGGDGVGTVVWVVRVCRGRRLDV